VGHPVWWLIYTAAMPRKLKRYQHEGDLHLITFSCYKRLPYLGTPAARDCFEGSFEAARIKFHFHIDAYVVMPEHVHLLVSEPPEIDLSRALNSLKLSVAKRLPQSPFWTPRYHDFNVFSPKKIHEKIYYIHENPAARGLVPLAEMWRWSSLSQYLGKPGVVTVATSRSNAPLTYQGPKIEPEGTEPDHTKPDHTEPDHTEPGDTKPGAPL
jgi:putative transposase